MSAQSRSGPTGEAWLRLLCCSFSLLPHWAGGLRRCGSAAAACWFCCCFAGRIIFSQLFGSVACVSTIRAPLLSASCFSGADLKTGVTVLNGDPSWLPLGIHVCLFVCLLCDLLREHGYLVGSVASVSGHSWRAAGCSVGITVCAQCVQCRAQQNILTGF